MPQLGSCSTAASVMNHPRPGFRKRDDLVCYRFARAGFSFWRMTGRLPEPNAALCIWVEGETGDFKCLTPSTSSPVLFGSRGFSLNRG